MTPIVHADDMRFAAPAVPFTADPAIHVHQELQRFIAALMKPQHLWPKINGKPDPPAEELMKLWAPLGCESEFLSHNEHGAPGVFRHRVGEDRKGNAIYEFSCTIRITSRRLGATVVVESNLGSDEINKRGVETTFLRQQCATRARKTALRILAGFDVDRSEEKKAQQRSSDEPIDGKVLLGRATALGLIPTADDKDLFIEWARSSVPACADLTASSVKVKHLRAIQRAIEQLEAAAL